MCQFLGSHTVHENEMQPKIMTKCQITIFSTIFRPLKSFMTSVSQVYWVDVFCVGDNWTIRCSQFYCLFTVHRVVFSQSIKIRTDLRTACTNASSAACLSCHFHRSFQHSGPGKASSPNSVCVCVCVCVCLCLCSHGNFWAKWRLI